MFVCRENQCRSNSNMLHRNYVKIRGVGADLSLVVGRTVVFSNCGARLFFSIKPICATHSYCSIADSERQ